MVFDSFEQLKLQFDHYVDLFNDNRFHLALNYLSSIKYKINL
ncbi:IS3 family transposase [Candidatus Schmidhempelia bombi]|uniref:Integrase catalytic domain-containing protein n=1 Tax=Candidatus Schmidhempelia bombi str. Bimp TaxID=1387197 RepID=A0AB94IC50_9GAMM|nr:hypothetical protein O970_06170 [Candidatus Schmidhempelia bombi str. Bimp]